MISFFIREAQVNDISDLNQIEESCFTSDKINKRQMHYLLCHAKSILFVACDTENTQILGYGLCLTSLNHKTARLYSLAVLPEFRGAHLATSLIINLLARLHECGYKHCHLEVRLHDIKTQSLYKKFGFVPVKTLSNYYQDGEDALRMRLTLPSTIIPLS